MGSRIGALIEVIIILGFIDAHTPENDGGMIAILQDHFTGISDSLFFPGSITDMLPSRDLCKDQHSAAVTFIQKVLTLGIMAGTYSIAAQLLLKNTYIFPL